MGSIVFALVRYAFIDGVLLVAEGLGNAVTVRDAAVIHAINSTVLHPATHAAATAKSFIS
jgi:hypothetical protein